MIKKILKIISLIFLTILVLTSTIILLHWKTDIVEKGVENYLNRVLKDSGKIHYKSLEGSLFNHLLIRDLDVYIPGQMDLKAQYVELRYNLWPLLNNRIQVSQVLIDQLDVNLHKTEISDSVATDATSDFSAINIDSLLNSFQQMHIADTLLDLLPEMTISDVKVFAGKINIAEPDIKLQDVQLNIEKLAIGKNNYTLRLRKAEGSWPERDFNLRALSLQLKGDRTHITLNQFKFLTDASRLSLSAYYRLQGELDININLYEFNLDFPELHKLIALDVLKDGFLNGTFSLSGSPRHFISRLDLNGSWHQHTLEKLNLDFDYNEGTFNFKKMELVSDSAEIYISGSGSQFGGGTGVVGFSKINLKSFDTTQVATNLNGQVQFDIKNFNLLKATGLGHLTLRNSKIDRVPIDSLQFALKAQRGNFEIIQPSYLQLDDSLRFNLEGFVGRKGNLDLRLSTFDNQLGRLASFFELDSLDAVYDGHIRLSGSYKDPTVSGNIWMPIIKYRNISFDSLSLDIYTDRIFSRPEGETSFEIKKGRIGQLPLRDIILQVKIDSNRVFADKVAFTSEKNFLKASMQFQYSSTLFTLRIPQLEISYEDYRLQNDGIMSFMMDSTEINVEHFRLLGPAGSAVELGGFWDFQQQDLQAYVILDSIKLQPFEQFWQKKFNLGGEIIGTIEILNPLHEPEISAEVVLDSLVYNGRLVGNIDSDFFFTGNSLEIQKFNFKNKKSSIDAQGDLTFKLAQGVKTELSLLEDTETQIDLKWSNINFEDYLPLLNVKKKIKGFTSGSIHVGGTTGHPQLIQSLSLSNFEYDRFKVDSLHMFSQYNDGYFLLDSLSGILNNTSFDLRGWLQYNLNLAAIDTSFLDKPFQVALRSKDNEISFIGELNEQVEAINGEYNMELHFGGTPQLPALKSGFIHLDDGEILLSRIRDPLQRVQLDAVVENSVLKLNRFSGYSVQKKDIWEKTWHLVQTIIPGSKRKLKEGRVLVNGEIGTNDLLRPIMDLNIRMDELYVDYFIENAAVVLTSKNLIVKGQDTLNVNGEIFIPKGTFEVDLAKMEKNLYLSETSIKQTPPFLAVNLDIQIPGNFVIASSPLDLANNFKIVILGDLQLIMEPLSDAALIAGHLETVSGKYASWNQNFDVQSGSIDFKNPKVINPDINLLVVKKIGPRLFEVIVSGNLEDLNKQIKITQDGQELDMSYLDMVTMLTLGADIQQITTQTDSTFRRVGEDVATTSALTAVERGAEKYTGLDKVEISGNESLVDLDKMRLNNGLRDASIAFGKYLTSDLYVEYRTKFGGEFPTPKLSWQEGNRLGLQYRINRFWSVDSYYEKTDRGNNKIQLGIKWELTF